MENWQQVNSQFRQQNAMTMGGFGPQNPKLLTCRTNRLDGKKNNRPKLIYGWPLRRFASRPP
jgi:hypothetical protein